MHRKYRSSNANPDNDLLEALKIDMDEFFME